MDELTCPQCQGPMASQRRGHASVSLCGGCGGVFLQRADLGALVEAENDWHAHRSTNTATLPRITADMAPPPAVSPARAFVETLFRS